MNTSTAGALLHFPLTTLLHALTRPVLNLIFYGGKTCISAVSERSLFYSTCPLSTLTCPIQACALSLKMKAKQQSALSVAVWSPQHNHTHTIPSSVLERSKESLTLLTMRLLVSNKKSRGKYISERQGRAIEKVRIVIWRLMHSYTAQCNKASLKPSLILKLVFNVPYYNILILSLTVQFSSGICSQGSMSWYRRREIFTNCLPQVHPCDLCSVQLLNYFPGADFCCLRLLFSCYYDILK